MIIRSIFSEFYFYNNNHSVENLYYEKFVVHGAMKYNNKSNPMT
jgi:hypothetical protein